MQPNADVFSKYTHTFQCGAETRHRTTWIEPLSHGLRHPKSLCNATASIDDRGYLVLAFGNDALDGGSSCSGRSCQNIYVDLGASLWGAGGPNQRWFSEAYKAHGIDFDRYVLWEAVKHDPVDVYKDVPAEMLHKYQYFNVPAAPGDGPGSALGILKQIVQPGDFVVFKLDIDNSDVELPIVSAFKESSEMLALVDEFFFEFHVTFPPMMRFWGPSAAKDKKLVDAYDLFRHIRSKGVRAHSWV